MTRTCLFGRPCWPSDWLSLEIQLARRSSRPMDHHCWSEHVCPEHVCLSVVSLTKGHVRAETLGWSAVGRVSMYVRADSHGRSVVARCRGHLAFVIHPSSACMYVCMSVCMYFHGLPGVGAGRWTTTHCWSVWVVVAVCVFVLVCSTRPLLPRGSACLWFGLCLRSLLFVRSCTAFLCVLRVLFLGMR